MRRGESKFTLGQTKQQPAAAHECCPRCSTWIYQYPLCRKQQHLKLNNITHTHCIIYIQCMRSNVLGKNSSWTSTAKHCPTWPPKISPALSQLNLPEQTSPNTDTSTYPILPFNKGSRTPVAMPWRPPPSLQLQQCRWQACDGMAAELPACRGVLAQVGLNTL